MDFAEFPALVKSKESEQKRVLENNAWRDALRVNRLRQHAKLGWKSFAGAGMSGLTVVLQQVAGAGLESKKSDDLAVENGGSAAENEKESSVSGDDGAVDSPSVADDAGSKPNSDEDDYGEEVVAESDENSDVHACNGQVAGAGLELNSDEDDHCEEVVAELNDENGDVNACNGQVAGAGLESNFDESHCGVEERAAAENEKESSVSSDGGASCGGGVEVSPLVGDAGSRPKTARWCDECDDINAWDGPVSSSSISLQESSVCNGDAGINDVAAVSLLTETKVTGAGLKVNSDDRGLGVVERAVGNDGSTAKSRKNKAKRARKRANKAKRAEESSIHLNGGAGFDGGAEVSPLAADAGPRPNSSEDDHCEEVIAELSDENSNINACNGQVCSYSNSSPESSFCDGDAGTNGVAEAQVASAGLESNSDDCHGGVEERAVENGGSVTENEKESSVSSDGVEVSPLVADAGSRPKTSRWSDECDDINAQDGPVNSNSISILESSVCNGDAGINGVAAVSLSMETEVAGAGLKSNSDDRHDVEERAVGNGGSTAKSRRNKAKRVRKMANKAKRVEESSVRVDGGTGFDSQAEVSPLIADAGTRPNSSEDDHREEVIAERRDENGEANACDGQVSSNSNLSPQSSVCNGDAVLPMAETPVADDNQGQLSSISELSPESSVCDGIAEVSPLVETPVADAGSEPQSDDNDCGQSFVCDGNAEVAPLVESPVANDEGVKLHSGEEERVVENGSSMMTKNAKRKTRRKAKKEKESVLSKPDSDTQSKSLSNEEDNQGEVEKSAPRVENGDAYAWQEVTYKKNGRKSSNPSLGSSVVGDEEPIVEEVAAGENDDSVKEKPKKAKKLKKKKKTKLTVAEAAAKIDAEYLGTFLAEISVSHESEQDAQLLSFAEYFDFAFANVSEAKFSWLKKFEESSVHNLVDMPLSHISESVLKKCSDWIGKRSSDALGRFLESTMDGIVADSESNEVSRPQVARFVVLAMVLRRKPDLLMSLRQRHQFPLTLWLITQASLGDLSVGLYMWSHCLLTKVGKSTDSPQSTEMMLQLVERILSAPKARTILLNSAAKKGERVVPPSALDSLMRLAFPASSACVKETERFESIYPLLKEVALAGPPGSKAMKKVAKQMFDFAYSAKQDIPNLTEEAGRILVWCSKQNPECDKKWEELKKEASMKDAENYRKPARRSSKGLGCIKTAVLVSVAFAAVVCQVYWFKTAL